MLSFKSFITEATGKIINAEDHPDYKKRSASEVLTHSPQQVHDALHTDATSLKIMSKGIKHPEGTKVGARLNLNVLKNTGVPVMTVHKATNKSEYKHGKGFYKGEAEGYHHVVALKNAHFNVDQSGREKIAKGEIAKHPMASVDGEIQHPKEHNFDGVEARFNPTQHHLFVDTHGHAIRSAEHVTLHGHRAYLRGKIEYHTPETAPKRKGDHPSTSTFKEEMSTYDIYFGKDGILSETKLSTAERLTKRLKQHGYDPDAALKRSQDVKKKLDADEKRYIEMGIIKPK